MSSKSRNFRRRAGSGDDDDESANGTTTSSSANPSTKSSSLAAKPKKTHQKLLSFADDEDGDAVPTQSSRPSSAAKSSSRLSKASSSHHRITASKDRVTPSASSSSVFSSSLPSNVQPQAGQYTKEALLELQRNTKTLRPPVPPSSQRKSSATPAEPVIVLKGLLKPPADHRKHGDEEANQDEEAERSTEGEKDETERKLALMGIGGIPDQATINAIKARKEKARKLRTPAPDFIALDMGSNHGEAEGLSDEEPEFQSRIAMFGEKVEGPRKGVFEDVDELALAGRDGVAVSGEFMAEVVEDEEDDEEERKWEEEQFRKGLGKRMDDGGASGLSSNAAVVQPIQKQKIPGVAVGPHSLVSIAPVGTPSIGGALASEVMPIAQQADVAKRALQDNLRRLKESYGKTMITLNQTDENLSASLTNVITLEEALSAAGEKFIFMQKLRDFVSVICDFLQHKAPYIEELEDQMQQLHKERASAVLERRTADNHDEMFEAEAAVSAAMSVFNKGGSSTATARAASAAAQAAIDALKEQRLPAELDEMGRDLNLQKRMDMTRRAAARQRRRSRLDNKRMSSIANGTAYHKIDGESSTDESDGEDAAYKSHRDLLLQTADHVFSDAAEEFSQLSAVQARFDKWKKVHLRSYNDAYMTLSVPAIFSPYVRLDFLKWDPLHEYVDFSDMNWHTVLFDYGRTEDGSDPDDDDDANLVPGLVEKIAIPILQYEITHCWDILSTKETKNAVLATVLVAAYVPSSEALKKLVTAVRDRLADSVANLVVPTWSALVLKAVPSAARLAAYRFGVAVRLLRNICLWKEILALPVLEKLALDELLAGKILPHVRSIHSDVHDAVTRTERVVDSLSGIWAGGSVTSARSYKLQPLVDHIVTLGKTLERRYASGVSEGGTIELVHRLKKMLKDLNEYDQARAMLRTFNIKEAV